MNKLFIYIIILIFSSPLYSYFTYPTSGGMCGEHADFQVAKSSFSDYWQKIVVDASKNAANYWNEAGSEHHLYYDGIGYDNPEIEYDNFWSSDSNAGLTYAWIWLGCTVTTGATIELNKNYFNKIEHQNSHAFQNTITHEFGHLLAIDHANTWGWVEIEGHGVDITPEEKYTSILMYVGTRYYTHLTEDDKHAARKLYGRDDQLIRTNLSNYRSSDIGNDSWIYYNKGNHYKSFAKPKIVYSSHDNYDYIMTWVKSTTKEVNYKFMNDHKKHENDLQQADDGTSENELGSRHWINKSYSLTTPSIAVSDDGKRAMIVWRQEEANKFGDKADDLWYAEIDTDSHSVNPTGREIIDNKNRKIDYFEGKSMSAPVVVWIEEWERFVIFYTRMSLYGMWSIVYLVEDGQGEFSDYRRCSNNSECQDECFIAEGETEGVCSSYFSLTDLKGDYLHSNWNPFDINCEQKYKDDKKACLLVYNKINISKNIDDDTPDSLTNTAFEVLIPNPNIIGNFIVKTPSKDINSDWDRKGYGHYSLASPLYTKDNRNFNTLNRITKSAMQTPNNLKFNLRYDITNSSWYLLDLTEESITGRDMNSRTGFSMTLNKKTNRYRYLWIEE